MEKEDNFENWEREAIRLLELKKFDELFNFCNKALELNAQNTTAWSFKAQYFQAKNQLKEAIACNKKVFEIEPKNSVALANIGALLGWQKLYEEAISFFDKALKLEPEEVGIWEMKGNCYASLKNYKEAVACYKKVLEIEPRNSVFLIKMGNCLSAQKLYEEAIAFFDKVLELDPSNSFALKLKNENLNLVKITTSQDKVVLPGPWPHPPVFPYLVARLVTGMFHVLVLPTINEEELVAIASAQALTNDLNTCLVLAPDRCIYFKDGQRQLSSCIPSDGILVTGSLKPSRQVNIWIATDATYSVRVALLAESIHSHPWTGCLLGDITKGGRQANAEELARLSGPNLEAPGVPKGLALCPVCHEYHGECLDPSPKFQGQAMTVSCRCDNKNRCAQCGGLLSERKLNANYYNPADGNIWHVPGFEALVHQCGGEELRSFPCA